MFLTYSIKYLLGPPYSKFLVPPLLIVSSDKGPSIDPNEKKMHHCRPPPAITVMWPSSSGSTRTAGTQRQNPRADSGFQRAAKLRAPAQLRVNHRSLRRQFVTLSRDIVCDIESLTCGTHAECHGIMSLSVSCP